MAKEEKKKPTTKREPKEEKDEEDETDLEAAFPNDDKDEVEADEE